VQLGGALEKLAVEGLPATVPAIKVAGGNIKTVADSVKKQLRSKALSNVTYTN
jgi:hypothetical protein